MLSVDDLLNQFDDNIPESNSILHIIYRLLKILKRINDIHNVLKFVTGGIQIPVIPRIKTSIEILFLF